MTVSHSLSGADLPKVLYNQTTMCASSGLIIWLLRLLITLNSMKTLFVNGCNARFFRSIFFKVCFWSFIMPIIAVAQVALLTGMFSYFRANRNKTNDYETATHATSSSRASYLSGGAPLSNVNIDAFMAWMVEARQDKSDSYNSKLQRSIVQNIKWWWQMRAGGRILFIHQSGWVWQWQTR